MYSNLQSSWDMVLRATEYVHTYTYIDLLGWWGIWLNAIYCAGCRGHGLFGSEVLRTLVCSSFHACGHVVMLLVGMHVILGDVNILYSILPADNGGSTYILKIDRVTTIIVRMYVRLYSVLRSKCLAG